MDNIQYMLNEKFSFIHSSDIHLGSMININEKLPESISKEFYESVYSSFERIFKAALYYNVDFIILAGDIYDRQLRTVKGRQFFYKESKKLNDNNIHIYVVRGNHDPLGEEKELFDFPQNVHVFNSDKVEVFPFKKNGKLVARIWGKSYKSRWETEKVFDKFYGKDDSVYDIGVMHTSLSKNSKYIPCNLGELKNKNNINYWALGHIHKFKVLSKDNPVIIYPGIPQGRDIGEQGVGGCVLVNVMEELSSDIKFIPTSGFIWSKITVNIDDNENNKPSNLNELEQIIIKKGEEFLNKNCISAEDIKFKYPLDQVLKGYIVRWSIEGRGDISDMLREDEEEIREYFKDRINNYFLGKSPFLYTESVVINTSKQIPKEYLMENQIINEINNISKQCLYDKNVRKSMVDSLGQIFNYKDDKEDVPDDRIVLSDDIINEIIENATEMIIEKFFEIGE